MSAPQVVAGICSRCSEPCDTVKDDDYGYVSLCCGWPLLPAGWIPPTTRKDVTP